MANWASNNSTRSYGVLSYDPALRQVTVFHPWGNHMKPAGPAGLVNGYPTQHGVFEVPLAEFVQIFAGFTYETDQPAAAGGHRAEFARVKRGASCPHRACLPPGFAASCGRMGVRFKRRRTQKFNRNRAFVLCHEDIP